MKSNQSIFDKVATHLLTQKKKCTTSSGLCVYRHVEKGRVLKCAAGCLIPKKDYNPDFEYQSVSVSSGYINRVTTYFKSKGYNESNLELIHRLQKTHDSMSSPRDWKKDLRKTATEFKLKSNVLRNF